MVIVLLIQSGLIRLPVLILSLALVNQAVRPGEAEAARLAVSLCKASNGDSMAVSEEDIRTPPEGELSSPPEPIITSQEQAEVREDSIPLVTQVPRENACGETERYHGSPGKRMQRDRKIPCFRTEDGLKIDLQSGVSVRTSEEELVFVMTTVWLTVPSCGLAAELSVSASTSSVAILNTDWVFLFRGSDSSQEASDSDQEEKPGPSKRKCPDRGSDQQEPLKVLTFDPTEIVNPRSTNWTPLPEVASYVQSHCRQGFDKDARMRLRSVCPRPDLDGKVSDTPEMDPTLVTFMKKWARDPKKGLDRAWRSCQDRLLDISGPMTKILEMGFQDRESGMIVDPDVLIGCHLPVGQRQCCDFNRKEAIYPNVYRP
ncbi:hypothetical protein NDU88_000099 [Pleurodeles waltl]|uniref:Uncharacterized protein n=1 Tax=Pleurodeles waltl TaxID=8319 RepID=A0AAV7KN52_PLEWA|nr:hypothetical protein NDU88_000099 [Pleurodeles waltl]